MTTKGQDGGDVGVKHCISLEEDYQESKSLVLVTQHISKMKCSDHLKLNKNYLRYFKFEKLSFFIVFIFLPIRDNL